MTNKELSLEFDISYDSIAGKSSPGIDLYEKSLYLTKAQLELVKNYYDPSSNRKKTGFEITEKRRNDLKELIVDFKTTVFNNSIRAISGNSKFVNIPDNILSIVYEKASLSETDSCGNTIISDIIPMSLDQYNTQIKNPFKKPDSSVIWRLDLSKDEGDTTPVVELISPNGISEYHMRYIKYPNPIILVDLDTEFPSEGLSIDGISAETSCELSVEIQREIIDRAVELALRDYKPQDLNSKVEIDQRNE